MSWAPGQPPERGREHPRRDAVPLPRGVDGGAALQQQPHHVRVAKLGRHADGGT